MRILLLLLFILIPENAPNLKFWLFIIEFLFRFCAKYIAANVWETGSCLMEIFHVEEFKGFYSKNFKEKNFVGNLKPFKVGIFLIFIFL